MELERVCSLHARLTSSAGENHHAFLRQFSSSSGGCFKPAVQSRGRGGGSLASVGGSDPGGAVAVGDPWEVSGPFSLALWPGGQAGQAVLSPQSSSTAWSGTTSSSSSSRPSGPPTSSTSPSAPSDTPSPPSSPACRGHRSPACSPVGRVLGPSCFLLTFQFTTDADS